MYDNGGWQPYALRPAGEMYGEFGTFDVTLILREDQVVAGTGLVVSGDPGWARAKKWGDLVVSSLAPYRIPALPAPALGAGEKAVRFHGENIHEFAWSTSPDYRYEGAAYVRARDLVAAPTGVTTWDTVAIHVLYRPGDESGWGNGTAVTRTKIALDWLEHVYGPYAYPQMINLHRVDGGGTEFPMMMMNGSPSQGLILHEGGHIFTFGILANNEWRSGWMDEGLTSYQTSWAEGNTPQDRAHRGGKDSIVVRPTGYRRHAPRPQGADALQLSQNRLEFIGRAQPIGTRSDLFSEFGIYNSMIYDRAELMYGALRDALGDSAFVAFMHRYYADWALQHVDERAMRTTAESVHGQSLGWFFDQWVRRTGVTDYALTRVERKQQPDGSWLTRGRVKRRAEYREPPPLGVLTSTGWTIARGTSDADDQWIEVRTAEKPRAVRLDPLRTTEDWDRRNDVAPSINPFRPAPEQMVRTTFDWPFLDQVSRDRMINAVSPIAWYSTANHFVGGVRSRSNYQGQVDRDETGIVFSSRVPATRADSAYLRKLQLWWIHENPTLPWRGRPLMGLRTTAWTLDGAAGAELSYGWDASRYVMARGTNVTRSIGLTYTAPRGLGYLPDRWDESRIGELKLEQAMRFSRARWSPQLGVSISGGVARGNKGAGTETGGYARGEAWLKGTGSFGADSARILSLRGFAGFASDETPLQRRIFASSRDPYQTLFNPFIRPRGGILARGDVRGVPLGGAGVRGFAPLVNTGAAVFALNAEHGLRLKSLTAGSRPLAIWGTVFADGALLGSGGHAADAGLGVMLRGWVFDRDVRVHVDFPVARGTSVVTTRPVRAYSSEALADRIQLTLGSFW